MTTATSPTIRARNAKYQANVTKRGHVKTSTQAEKKASKPAISPYLVAFLLIILFGGAVFEILRLLGVNLDFQSS
ncbi:hypothetical protein BGX34_010300 [Mortierella sp. NVP85]|nr:hypothetical protein BGX34_010300 [Mortierella sp. NVP85]